MIFNLNNFFQKKYHPIFKDEVDLKKIKRINNILDEKIKDDRLKDYKVLLKESFYAIYKESPLDFNEFLERLDNRLDYISIGICRDNTDGNYVDSNKTLTLNEKLFEKGPTKDITGNIRLNEKETLLSNEYKIIRTIIHESLHVISNNDFIDINNSDNSLMIFDELKTVQLESLIYNTYFSSQFKKQKEIVDKNTSNLEYYLKEHTIDNNFYNVLNNSNFRGYKIINTMANYIHLIDSRFDNVYWGKENLEKTNLKDTVFYNFEEKAYNFCISVVDSGNRLNINDFFEFQKSFYTCIDYQIKQGRLNKDEYLDLKESILSNQFEFPKKVFGQGGSFFNDYENSLKFDIYYLSKII